MIQVRILAQYIDENGKPKGGQEVRDEVIQAVVGTKDLTESIDSIMALDSHGVIEAQYRYSTYRPYWYMGSESDCARVIEILGVEEPDKIFEIVTK